MSKGSILLIIPRSGFLFVVDPVFNHFESRQKKTKGSETPVSSGDCLDPSDLHADFFSARECERRNPVESSLSHVFVSDFSHINPLKSTQLIW